MNSKLLLGSSVGLLVVASLTGCTEQSVDLDETAQHTEVANGVSLNGVSLNGVSLNGVSLNGVSLNGVSLNGVSLNGVSLNGVSLNGTRSDDGSQLTVNTVGPTLTATLSNGATLPLKVERVSQLTGANSDVSAYDVVFESDGGWQPLCGNDAAGAPIAALAVSGVWNTETGVTGGGAYAATTSSFTFACRHKTIAKCVELGYKTWTGRTSQLESCVRLIRGDFCGDGTPYTADGATLNLYDNVGIQTDTNAWMIEGEWTPAGARCITQPRLTRFQQQLGITPPCAAQLSSGANCGVSFANGAVLIDELP